MEKKVVLHFIGKEELIEREKAKKLWSEGKLAGIFNIPFDNEALFDTCQDFCIQSDLVSPKQVQSLEGMNVFLFHNESGKS
jgi:hypothetical protein